MHAAALMSLALWHCAFAENARHARSTRAGERPAATHALASAVFPAMVHWPDDVTADDAAQVLAALESSWSVLFGRMGFRVPRSDGAVGDAAGGPTDGEARFDVYLVTDLPAGVGGYTGFSGMDEKTPEQDAIGYLVLAANLGERLKPFVVAHELFHASQMAYDWWEDIAFMEASATMVVELVHPENDVYARYLPYFNAEPWRSLDYVSLGNPYQYGMGLYPLFLEERLGGGDGRILREIWERSAQASYENEPDFLDAVGEIAGGSSASDELFREFGAWRWETSRFRDGASWDATVRPYLEVDVPPGVTHLEGSFVHALAPLSHAYVRVSAPAAARAITLELRSEPGTQLAIDALATGATVTPLAGAATPGDVGLLLAADPLRTEAVFVITSFGDGSYDPDASTATAHAVRYRLFVAAGDGGFERQGVCIRRRTHPLPPCAR